MHRCRQHHILLLSWVLVTLVVFCWQNIAQPLLARKDGESVSKPNSNVLPNIFVVESWINAYRVCTG
jgi:hypothetical protein